MENQARASHKHKPLEAALSGQAQHQQHSPSPRRTSQSHSLGPNAPHSQPKAKSRRSRNDASDDTTKRRCISTACVACRKRKSKCDGNTPSCAACASVYGTPCVYDPNSDHRRKGVYKKDVDSMKTNESTLQIIVSAILNYPQDEVPDLVRQIRACESLEKVAEAIVARENGEETQIIEAENTSPSPDLDEASFERQLYSKVGELRLEDGSVRFIGGTSNLVYDDTDAQDTSDDLIVADHAQSREQIVGSWTSVDASSEMILHLLNLYFTWHYPFFTLLSQSSFWQDFNRGNTGRQRKTEYCSPLLVNAMLALGCHFSSMPSARANSEDLATAGDHFFQEAKRLIDEGDEYAKPKITTVQALALMSVREAGCGREAKGWVYSGIAFRMACDLGINFETEGLMGKESGVDEEEEDVRRLTFWGCFLIDKCWSNYLGRLPFFQTSDNVTVSKYNVLPTEDAQTWTPYTDSGFLKAHSQASRVRAVALQLSALCDISGDLMKYFYHPQDKHPSRQIELNRLGEIHTKLETWHRNLPKEMEPHEGSLPSVLVMHMLFQLLHIHLFRPFLKYAPNSSPLPSHVSPRKLCTNAASTISKLLRLYKRSYGLRQICNISVYIAHSACTIHLLNLPDKNAARDISHGVRQLEEIADCWPCARRTLRVLSLQARKWQIDLPEDAAQTLARTDAKYNSFGSPKSSMLTDNPLPIQQGQVAANMSTLSGLQLQSPWSAQSSDRATSLAGSMNLTSGANTSAPPTQQHSPKDPSFMVLPPNFQQNGQLRRSSQSSTVQHGHDVHASYINLLQQQQAWNEAAARNGIPAMSTYGQAGSHQSVPAPSLFRSEKDDAEHGGAHMSTAAHLLAAAGTGPTSGSLFPQTQSHVSHNSIPASAASMSQPSAQAGLKTMPKPQISHGHRISVSGQDAQMLLQTSRPARQQQQEQHNKVADISAGPATEERRRQSSFGGMFGGVEALLREGQDWWVEDQTQFASVFSKWHSASSSPVSMQPPPPQQRGNGARTAGTAFGGPAGADGVQPPMPQHLANEVNDDDGSLAPGNAGAAPLDLSGLLASGADGQGGGATDFDEVRWFG